LEIKRGSHSWILAKRKRFIQEFYIIIPIVDESHKKAHKH